MVNTLNAVMCSFSNPAAVTVVDKSFFKNRRYIIVDKVVYYSVPKISSEYFALYGLVHNKTDTGFRFIVTRKHFICKSKQIGFQMLFKGKRMQRIAFVFSCNICIYLKTTTEITFPWL